MIIEQVEALKAWLTTKLSPICDAEPSALAKYVCALVKKDKPEEDLRDICLDQLDVFLQLKTKPFVNELFETLKSKSYIPPSEEKKPPAPVPAKRPLSQPKDKDEPAKKKVSEISSTTGDKDLNKENTSLKESKDKDALVSGDAPKITSRDSKDHDGKELRDTTRDNKETRAPSRERREGERDRRDSWKDERNKEQGIRDARDIIREREGRDTREVREPREREVREPREREVRDRDRDYRRPRRTRSRSFSPRRNYPNPDDRIRRRFDDRYRYSPERRWARRRSWSRSPRRNRSPVGRPRSRSPRLRSRSPRLRSRSPRERFRSFRSRTRSRSRSPRARSWSRPGSGGAGGGYVRSRSPQAAARQPDSRGSTPILDNDYSALISSSTNELPSVSSTVGPPRPLGDGQPRLLSVGRGGRSRCVDFEERGFCMRGDMCPFDHGTDPVVVEDVPIPNVVAGAAPPPGAAGSAPGSGFVPPDMRVPPPVPMGVRMNMRRLPPPNIVEPYMPEAPGLRGPHPPFLRGMPPNLLRQPPPGMMMNRPPMERMLGPPPREVILQPPQPGADDDDLDPLIGDKEPARIVIPAKRPYNVMEENPMAMPPMGPPPPHMPHINQHHHMFVPNQPPRMPFPPQVAGPPRKAFDYNRLGRGGQHQYGNRPAFKTGNLTLEVRKIPAELNNIAKINEHFGKFGNLTNIQVKFQGDASAALITFSNNGEATAAYKSPEPVFNNRFIKLFWHNPAKSNTEDGAGASGESETKAQGPETSQFSLRAGGRVGDGIDHPSLVLPVRPTIPPAHKLFLDNTKPKQTAPSPGELTATSETAKPVDKSSVVYTSSVGHLKKTMFNQAAGPSKPKANVPTSPTTTMNKPSDFVSRIEAIKRAEEGRKIATVKQAELDVKKQELLAKQIQQQKLLIETLDKKKATMSEEEKASLLKALKTISDAIDKVKYAGGVKKATFQTPTPSQMKFVSPDQASAPPPVPSYSYGRGRGWASGQPSVWSSRGRGRGAGAAVGRTSLDNRPKTIEIKDFDLDEVEEVKLHFQRFGEFEKVELVETAPSIFITYVARQNAEMAMVHGRKFKTKILTIRWNQMMQKIVRERSESVQSSELDDDDLSVTLGSLEEEALRNISAEKPEVSVSASQPLQETVTAKAASSPGDSRSMLEDPPLEAGNPLAAVHKRTLSEDLLMGDEHNFKASYTDDEDDEDHITVTLSNTVSTPSWVYAGVTEEAQRQPEEGEGDLSADLDMLANTEADFAGEDNV